MQSYVEELAKGHAHKLEVQQAKTVQCILAEKCIV